MTYDELEQRLEELERENRELKERLARAKDPNPTKRPTFRRVKELLAKFSVELSVNWINHRRRGYIISLGSKMRIFKRLWDIFVFITRSNWTLEELFTPEPEEKPKKEKKQPICKKCNTLIKWHKEWLGEDREPTLTRLNLNGTVHQCPAKCNYCDQLIEWRKRWNGNHDDNRYVPLNSDGTLHRCDEYREFNAVFREIFTSNADLSSVLPY